MCTCVVKYCFIQVLAASDADADEEGLAGPTPSRPGSSHVCTHSRTVTSFFTKLLTSSLRFSFLSCYSQLWIVGKAQWLQCQGEEIWCTWSTQLLQDHNIHCLNSENSGNITIPLKGLSLIHYQIFHIIIPSLLCHNDIIITSKCTTCVSILNRLKLYFFVADHMNTYVMCQMKAIEQRQNQDKRT